jgi:hypothetical protein
MDWIQSVRVLFGSWEWDADVERLELCAESTGQGCDAGSVGDLVNVRDETDVVELDHGTGNIGEQDFVDWLDALGELELKGLGYGAEDIGHGLIEDHADALSGEVEDAYYGGDASRR